MDLQVFYIPTVLAVPLAVIIILYLYTTYKQTYFKRHGIPGPRPTPMFGQLPALMKDGFFNMDIRLVRENGTFFGTYIGNSPSLMIADPNMIREICIKEFSLFTDHTTSIPVPKFWQNGLNNATGDHWRFLRATLSPTFTSGKLKNMNRIAQRCMDDFVECLNSRVEASGSHEVDIHAVFGSLTMDVICSTAFGIEVNSQKNPDSAIVKHSKRVMDFSLGRVPAFLLMFLFPEIRFLINKMDYNVGNKESMDYLLNTIKSVIAERRANPSSEYRDTLQLMVNAHKEEATSGGGEGEEERRGTLESFKRRGLTDDEIVANSIIFLVAGYDTTASTLTWLAYCLAVNSECQDRLIQEIDDNICKGSKATYDAVFKMEYLDMAISETLRLYPPAARINRTASREVVVCGRRIPKGANVQFPISGIHRLDQFWPDPDRFDPERFSRENKGNITPFSYMPFGTGPRNCIGMRLALMEVKMAAVTLLQHFRLHTCDRTDVPPKLSKGIVLKPEAGMFLRLEKR